MAPSLTITCPHCKSAGRVEVEIPEEGKLLVCPSCHYRFYVSPDGSTKRRQAPPQPTPPPPALNERHVDFVKQLDAEMPGWEREGIISADQRLRIIDRYTKLRPVEKKTAPSRLISILSILGVILVGTGIFTFVAANWSALPRTGKLALIIGAMFASYSGGYYLRYGQRHQYPRVGGALILLGGIIFGAAIYFVAQLYHISVHYPNGPLIWGIALLPLAYLTALPSLLFLAIADLLAWLALEGSFHQGSNHDLSLMVLVGAAGVSAWLMGCVHQRRKQLVSLALPWQTAGALATLGALFPFTFVDTFHQQLTMGGLAKFHLGIGTIAVIAIGLLIAGEQGEAGWWQEPAAGILLLGFFLLTAGGMLAVPPELASLAAIVFNLLYAMIIVGTIALGFQRQNMAQINIALLFFVVDLIARYVDVFWQLLPRSLFFIAGGLLLIAGGVFLERKRRIVLANLQDQEVTGVR